MKKLEPPVERLSCMFLVLNTVATTSETDSRVGMSCCGICFQFITKLPVLVLRLGKREKIRVSGSQQGVNLCWKKIVIMFANQRRNHFSSLRIPDPNRLQLHYPLFHLSARLLPDAYLTVLNAHSQTHDSCCCLSQTLIMFDGSRFE